MELQAFTVPVPVDRACDALLDPQRIAPCMPSASFESVEGDAFTGNVKIKLVRSTCPIAAGLAASPTPPTCVIGTGGPPVSPWPCTRGSHRRPNSIARGGEQDPARTGRGHCGCCRRGGHGYPAAHYLGIVPEFGPRPDPRSREQQANLLCDDDAELLVILGIEMDAVGVA
jgi:hypothetical protein